MTAATLTRPGECRHWLTRANCGDCTGRSHLVPPLSEWSGDGWTPPGPAPHPWRAAPCWSAPPRAPDPLDPNQEDDDA